MIGMDQDPLIMRIKACVEAQDPRRFKQLVEEVSWHQHTPAVLVAAIEGALQLDLPSFAQHLVRQGGAQFPNDATLQRIQAVLAPPQRYATQPAHATGLQESQSWLRDHADAYHGQWVAVRHGHPVGVAPTLAALRATLTDDKHPADTLISRVL